MCLTLSFLFSFIDNYDVIETVTDTLDVFDSLRRLESEHDSTISLKKLNRRNSEASLIVLPNVLHDMLLSNRQHLINRSLNIAVSHLSNIGSR